MQMIIEARLVYDVQETARIHLAVVDRHSAADRLLPIHDSISVTSVKRRVRVVGKALEESSARLPSAEAVPPVAPYRKLSAVAVDSAWLRHCDPPRELGQGHTSTSWPVGPASRTTNPGSVPMSTTR